MLLIRKTLQKIFKERDQRKVIKSQEKSNFLEEIQIIGIHIRCSNVLVIKETQI